MALESAHELVNVHNIARSANGKCQSLYFCQTSQEFANAPSVTRPHKHACLVNAEDRGGASAKLIKATNGKFVHFWYLKPESSLIAVHELGDVKLAKRSEYLDACRLVHLTKGIQKGFVQKQLDIMPHATLGYRLMILRTRFHKCNMVLVIFPLYKHNQG